MPNRHIQVTVDKKPYPLIPTNVSVIFSDIPGTASPEDVVELGLAFTEETTMIEIYRVQSTGAVGTKNRVGHTFGLKYQEGRIYFVSAVLVREEDEMKTKTYILTKDNVWRDIEECPLEEALPINIPELSLDQ